MNIKQMQLIRTCILLVMIGLSSCSQINFDLPHGPQGQKGDKGDKGDNGESAYQIWKANVTDGQYDWPEDKTELSDYMKYIKGEKGDTGLSSYELWKAIIAKGDVVNPHDKNETWDPNKNTQEDFWNFMIGRDGQTPYIGNNNNWFIGGEDTGIPAKGKNGQSAYEQWKQEVEAGTITDNDGNTWSPENTSDSDFFRYLKGRDGKNGQDGQDGQNGLTPSIGDNGNWFIGDKDTGIKAQGPKGDKGDNGAKGADGLSAYDLWKKDVANGSVQDKEGNTWPESKNTQEDFFKYLQGQKGDKGDTGLSTYEFWKAQVMSGQVDDPHQPGTKWEASKTQESDFWNFLSGSDGVSPHIGTNGNWFVGDKDTGVKAQGPKGDTGDKGSNGLSAYEFWKEELPKGNIRDHNNNVWSPENSTISDYFRYLKGQDGLDGQDGLTPHIGDNGNWFIGTQDTGVKAQGPKGDTGDKGPKGDKGDKGKTGDKGPKGDNGQSAYELWKHEVASGSIQDKEGNTWPADQNSQTDFFKYLKGDKGDKGDKGKSAYQIWKELAETGNLDNPKAGTGEGDEKWPENETSQADFYRFLTGKNGAKGEPGDQGPKGDNGNDGAPGLSAYEIWKKDLAERCGTTNALTDHRNGGVWDCTRNTLNDFYEFLRGADGSDGTDGTDGRPGAPGSPGATVVIKEGIPNVIANYSQSEFGEYVRTTDGGVEYTVYDTQGQPAPGATVKGLPGIDPERVFTSNNEGKFIIPREDLPWIEDVNQRWGTVKEVTIAGEEPRESARNTYVPNKIKVRLNYRSIPSLYYYFTLYLNLERKISPDSEWEVYPSYLPRIATAYNFTVVSNKEDPTSLTSTILYTKNLSPQTSGYIYSSTLYRPMFDNVLEIDNSQKVVSGDTSPKFFTVISEDKLYGQIVKWNGTCELPPLQLIPHIKSIKLRGYKDSNPDHPYFESLEGVLDFSTIDFNWIYRGMIKEELSNGVIIIKGDKYTPEEAKNLQAIYVKVTYKSTAFGIQTSTSENEKSNEVNPTFRMLTPYLNGEIQCFTIDSQRYFKESIKGKIRKRDGVQEFYIEWSDSKMPETTVTYEP